MMRSNPEVQALIRQLVESMAETAATLSRLAEGDLDRISGHPCAMGGTVRKLVVHNLAHDRMHLGQIHEKRWALDVMQEGDLPRLLAESVTARAGLVAALLDLPDEALDRRPEEGATTIREVIEHVLYWERNSMAQTREKFLEEQPA
jgi:DinB superfamily